MHHIILAIIMLLASCSKNGFVQAIHVQKVVHLGCLEYFCRHLSSMDPTGPPFSYPGKCQIVSCYSILN